MTALTWVLLAFAVIGLLFGLWQWTARRRTVQRLDNMLEQSISGFGGYFDVTALKGQDFPCQIKPQAKPLRRVS